MSSARRQIGVFSIPEDKLPSALLAKEAIGKASGNTKALTSDETALLLEVADYMSKDGVMDARRADQAARLLRRIARKQGSAA